MALILIRMYENNNSKGMIICGCDIKFICLKALKYIYVCIMIIEFNLRVIDNP